ncbi:MAG: DUF4349 domain-containing protein [Brevundimonas sp.]|nr:DUF4349 domain-containing protein [Brevundimonas sp.]
MRKGLMLAAASVIVLAACQPADQSSESRYAEDAASVSAADAAPPETAARSAAPGEPLPPVQPPAPIAKIAYAFSYVMSVPRDRGAELMSRHELACASAGAGYCQVVSARAAWTARAPGGRLERRGQPDWINRFRGQLATDARNAGGRLDSAVTEGEDVTRGLDAAATGAKTTASLADRIRDLQARRGGTLEQRLEIERQLAELQRQYDAQQLELRALEDRVQSALLTLDYRQGGVMAADSPTRPVARALSDAFGLSMGMLAVLITISSALLPVAVIGGAVWWAVVRRRKAAAA